MTDMAQTQLSPARASWRARLTWPAWLPTGTSIGQDQWAKRHRAITVLLWLHVVGVPVYGIVRGELPRHAVAEGSILAVMALVASWRACGWKTRTVMATLGLVSASGILTHFSGGLIEMHFHF